MTSPQTPQNPPPQNHRGRAIFWLTTILIFIAAGWVLLWFFYFRFYEWTDDAYANGNMIDVTSVISGTPIAFYADDTDLVKEGQLLISLDPTYYQIAFDKEMASLASTVLQVRQLYDNVTASATNLATKKTVLERVRYDYDNRSKLVDSKAISNEDYVHSSNDLKVAELNVVEAEFQLKIAKDAAGNTTIENHPLIQVQKNNVRQAYYNLIHCEIYAPYTGYIAQRAVEVGQWVTPNIPLMAIIPIDYMWVDANYKETQLTYMRIGQPARVTLDIYGDSVEYKGKVIGIASGTGSVFSIIPAQNATGNWIKIVQRLPVRISLDPETMKKYPLRLGLSANVRVSVDKTDLPILAETPPSKPVATTQVFDINMEEIDQRIEKVIQENMRIPLSKPK